MHTSSRCRRCKPVTLIPMIYIPAAFEGLFLKVDTTNVRDRVSSAREATLVRTSGVCTAVVCFAFIVGLDNVIFQVGQASECADLAERVLGKLGRRFKQTLI
jgi:hypothetical protein